MSSRDTEPHGNRFWPFGPAQWIAVILIVLAIVFVAQNRASMAIHLFWMTISAPQWFVLVLLVIVGLVAGYLLGRRRAKNRGR
ncbi:DUF1049 domain-containing protein [Glaciibacter superstes]|uniref:DUF1049 domain-containing protein n=1 Tax=Glaciibacter superstes TaxID=501023 RepID=UPI0003B4B118|nr:DUF1049 domain-containing protein [Glaciibacter superstes]